MLKTIPNKLIDRNPNIHVIYLLLSHIMELLKLKIKKC